jgi:pimeloyl-ACP methyl ester carboxylesterase
MTTLTSARRDSTQRKPSASGAWPIVLFGLVGACVTLILIVDGELSWRITWLVTGVVVTWLAIRAWRIPGRWGGAAALAFAVIGFAVGIGIGLRWLSVSAVGFAALVSILALPVALVLAGLGIGRLTTGLRPVSRLISGGGLVLVLAVAVWTFTPAVLAANVPPIPLGEVTPSDFGLEAEEVRFSTSEGTELWAWYVPPPEGAVVLLRHGSGSTAEDALPQAAVIAGQGYGVLITDARGHGRSGGSAMDFGWYGTDDISAAMDFLIAQPGVDPARVAVVGLSMGGEEALGAAGADDRIAAVVAEGATARSEADKIWLVDEYGWRGRIQVALEWLQYALTKLLTDADKPPPLASAVEAAAPRSVLLITAGDVPDERYAAEHIQAKAGDNVSIWTVSGAGHIEGLRTDPEGWERNVIDFLDQNLKLPVPASASQ